MFGDNHLPIEATVKKKKVHGTSYARFHIAPMASKVHTDVIDMPRLENIGPADVKHCRQVIRRYGMLHG